jgi:outer membrane protein TolC
MIRNFFLTFAFVVSSMSQSWAADELTWQDCLREAAKNHPDLISAQESVLQSEAVKKITAANYWPDISADLNASTAKSTDTGSNTSFSYGFSASQLLFDGAKTINNIHAASEDIQAAKFAFKFTSSEIRLRLREAFINLLKAQKLTQLTQEIYTLRKNNLELIALRYESGTEHKGALLTAKANLSAAVFEINSAKRAQEVAERALIKEMGRREFTPVVVQGDFDAVSFQETPPPFEALADKTPTVLKIIAQRNAAAYDVKVSRGEFWPSIVLNGDAAKSDNQWLPKESGTSAGVKVSLPLFSGGANTARLAQSRSIYRQFEEQERSVRDGVVLSLQNNWNDFADAIEKVHVQKDFLDAVEERAKIAQAQYAVGLISFDNWTIIEDSLVSGRKIFLDVQAAALTAEANWIQAQGETLEYEN